MRLPTLNLQRDEVWSVWQTLGTPAETIAWTPFDWSPAYYLIVWVWRELTGITPFTARILTILTMLITVSVLYRLGRRLYGVMPGLLAVAIFIAFGYILFLSTLQRAYMLSVLLWLCAFWLVLTEFERDKPSWGRLFGLGMLLVGMFYVHITSVYGMVALGLYSLVRYGWKRLYYWSIPISTLIVLSAVEIASKLNVIRQKNEIVNQYIPYVPPEIRIANLYIDFGGSQAAVFGAFLIIALALILEKTRVRFKRPELGILLMMVAPFGLIWVTAFVDAFNPRHLAWIMVALALWIGWGLSLLPRAAKLAVIVVAVAVMSLDTIPFTRYETIPRMPLVTGFTRLKELSRAGDALFVDLDCIGCAPVDREEWDYFIRAYFPSGFPQITADQINPFRGYKRIWHAYTPGKQNPGWVTRLQAERAPSHTFGDSTLTFQLYELPPLWAEGIEYENGMMYLGAEIIGSSGATGTFPPVVHEGETITVRLFWAAEKPVTLDYSVGVYQLPPNAPTGTPFSAQVDGAPVPINGAKETSRWEVKRRYVEERTLKLSYPLKTGEQSLYLAVYQWWDGVRVKAGDRLTPDLLLEIGRVWVKSL